MENSRLRQCTVGYICELIFIFLKSRRTGRTGIRAISSRSPGRTQKYELGSRAGIGLPVIFVFTPYLSVC